MQIRLASDLQEDSVVDGLGVRTVIWTQGCGHKCPGCHNPSTHDFDSGELVDVEDVISALDQLERQDGITFSGGDPFYQPKACSIIAKYCHKINLNVWCYTGFTYEQLIDSSKKNEDIMSFLKQIDILVDGPFIMARRSFDVPFRGSDNQRVIDVKKSLQYHKIILVNLDDDMIISNNGRYQNNIYL